MTDIEQLLIDAADYIESLLQSNPQAEQDLILARAQGQEPNIMRVVTPKTVMLIRFQDEPK